MESTLEYQPRQVLVLTVPLIGDTRQCLVGSLTGAVASQKVTEASKGSLGLVGNQASEYKGNKGA